MEIKCKVLSAYRDWVKAKNIIVLETDNDCLESAIGFGEKMVRATLKQWREKRSLDANAYYWQLVTKISAELGKTNTEQHNEFISEYGQFEIMDGSLVNFILLDTIPWQKLDHIHLKPTAATKVMDDGKLYRVYRVMRGSHTYDSKEMSVLIDGAVEAAKELGIETLPPDELERMKAVWKV